MTKRRVFRWGQNFQVEQGYHGFELSFNGRAGSKIGNRFLYMPIKGLFSILKEVESRKSDAKSHSQLKEINKVTKQIEAAIECKGYCVVCQQRFSPSGNCLCHK